MIKGQLVTSCHKSLILEILVRNLNTHEGKKMLKKRGVNNYFEQYKFLGFL